MRTVDKQGYSLPQSHPQYAAATQQQGMALLIVLFMVLLLAAASVIALRDSQTSLNLTTAAQANQLLFSASDVPLAHIDKILQQPHLRAQWLTEDGPIGYLLRSGEPFATAEYVVCYQPTQHKTLYAGADQHKIITQKNGVKNPKGYCHINADTGNYFTSERRVVATQISFVRLDELTSDKRITDTHTRASTDMNNLAVTTTVTDSQSQPIRAYVVSVIPVLSRVDLSEVDACLALPMIDNSQSQHGTSSPSSTSEATNTNPTTLNKKSLSLIACLQRAHTPYNLQVQDYIYRSQIQTIAGTKTQHITLTPLQWFDYSNHLYTQGGY